jgi:hypothetical protein
MASKAQRPSGKNSKIQVLFVAGFGPIVPESVASWRLYAETLGIAFNEVAGGYLHTEKLDGSKHFALWPLGQAAQSCFGTSQWPEKIPVPQAWVEFDVANIRTASAELKKRGYRLLVDARREPWGQTVTRFLSPEGILVGVTHTPWMRE